MEKTLLLLTVLPLGAGIVLSACRAGALQRRLAQAVLLLSTCGAVWLFARGCEGSMVLPFVPFYDFRFCLHPLGKAILPFVGLFGFLVSLYSGGYSSLKTRRLYQPFLLALVAASNAACLSGDFISFLFAWGTTLLLLYALVAFGSFESAEKTLAVVGFGDFCLLLGLSFYIFITGTSAMPQGAKVVVGSPLTWFTFLLMLCGALAKAGCGPFHTWIPSAAKSAPLPVMAILPASIDKLLGIYLLARICVDFFVLPVSARALLLFLGSATILFAVVMALMQHDLRTLLSFHAVSQVGYMVLGFGTGLPLGIAGGVFHMFNHALYKSGLFLAGGAVGERRATFSLEKLGGLASAMPLSFLSATVFAFAISGIPPLNGFSSKWMLYQATIAGLSVPGSLGLRALFLAALISALFGSVLTLASFIKFLHALFLGQDHSGAKKPVSEVSASQTVPMLVLAGFCILFGLFPGRVIKALIEPWLGVPIGFTGTYNSLVGFIVLAAGLLLGVWVWRSQRKTVRTDACYLGGEESTVPPATALSFPAVEFYRGILDIPAVHGIYWFLSRESLDLFALLKGSAQVAAYVLFIFIDRFVYALTILCGRSVLGMSWVLRRMHSGVLDRYLLWFLAGMLAMIFLLRRPA